MGITVKLERNALNGKSHATYQSRPRHFGQEARRTGLPELAILGSSHPYEVAGALHCYTQNFKLFTSETNERSLLAGEGILIAARELMTPEVQAI